MPGIKPSLDQKQVLSLLYKHFADPSINLSEMEGGQVAQTFVFTVNGQDYVLRFITNRMGATFAKEAYLQRRLDLRIPLPPIIHTGSFQEQYYAISHRVPGKPMIQLSWAEYEQVVPSLIEMVDAIHHADVSGTEGYGVFNDQGGGMFSSWKQFLSSVREEEEENDFYGKWHVLFQETFLEREVFDFIYDHMLALLDACPEDRFLLHGGPGHGNVIVHAGKITGVIDWLDAQYGDFVHDIAALDLWVPEIRFAERFQQYYAAQGISVPAYAERLRCYECHIGLDALRFFAKARDESAYQWTCQRILSLLGE